jgi:putative cardiolipin synthase
MQTTASERPGRAGILGSLTLFVAFALAGCAALPDPVDRPVTYASADAGSAALARIAATSTPIADPTLSGFRLLPDGEEAFAARLALIRRAEKTIDVQYS